MPASVSVDCVYADVDEGFTATLRYCNDHVILDADNPITNGEIVMPDDPVNHKIVNITCNQDITNLTITPGAGQTIKGAPTSLVGGQWLGAVYRADTKTWHF